jgi:hypothetical protein
MRMGWGEMRGAQKTEQRKLMSKPITHADVADVEKSLRLLGAELKVMPMAAEPNWHAELRLGRDGDEVWFGRADTIIGATKIALESLMTQLHKDPDFIHRSRGVEDVSSTPPHKTPFLYGEPWCAECKRDSLHTGLCNCDCHRGGEPCL